MQKLKIAFDPTNNWEYQAFRDLIHDMVLDVTEIEVYIITTNTDVDYIDRVAVEAGGIDTNHIYQVVDNATVVTTLANKSILIYLTRENELVTLVNDSIPLDLQINNITGCEALLTNNSIQDTYRIQAKYITMLQFWIKQIEKYTSGGEKVC